MAASRGGKRPQPPLFGGIDGTDENRDDELLCPVCLDEMREPYVTTCGHSFCHSCIVPSLRVCDKCPQCSAPVQASAIFPNCTLNTLIVKRRRQQVRNGSDDSLLRDFNALLDQKELSAAELGRLQDLLASRKCLLESERRVNETQLLAEFLHQLHMKKTEELRNVQSELAALDRDLRVITSTLETISLNKEHAGSQPDGRSTTGLSLGKRRVRMHHHLDDLEKKYWSLRSSSTPKLEEDEALNEFQSNLNQLTRYSAMQPLATLSYGNDLLNAAHIVSSIEFDRDCDFFAIAGVTKRIKVYEYSSVVRDLVDLHYPVIEMVANSKISCVSWSNYHKSVLCSSDYEGSVSLWDAAVGARLKIFQEHEKRCWSVDFNQVDSQLIASGSDDSRVKIWSQNAEHSVATLEAKANVCCVKFNPNSRYHLAYGAADHCVHYVDLRNPKQPLRVFKGHRKAVSYVKFLNEKEMVSASTDSQLKLWAVEDRDGERCTFRGHTNEKNFVGLSNDGEFIACGSENNALYLYCRGLGKPLFDFKFDVVKSVLESGRDRNAVAEEDSAEFISAVCWKPNSNVILAANSQGTIKVLELV